MVKLCAVAFPMAAITHFDCHLQYLMCIIALSASIIIDKTIYLAVQVCWKQIEFSCMVTNLL